MSAAHDIEAERHVVAYYLVLRNGHPSCSQVRAEHLSVPKHAAWWSSALHQKSDGWLPSDLGMSISEMSEYSDIFVLPHMIVKMEHRVIDHWCMRSATSAAASFADAVRSGGAQVFGEAMEALVAKIADVRAGGSIGSVTHAEAGKGAIESWSSAVSSNISSAIPMPIPAMQSRLGGWPRRKLCIVGGRSSEHKTTLVRQSAEYAAVCGYKVLFWTAEDSYCDIAGRTISANVAELDTMSLGIGKWPAAVPKTPAAMGAVLSKCNEHLGSSWVKWLRYIDEAAPKLSRVLGVVRAEAARGLDMFVFDYLQLAQCDSGERNTDFWRRVSSGMAQLAKELDIVVICTSQIDKVGTRESDANARRPRSTDMLYGTALTQDAHGVIMIWKTGDSEVGIAVDKWKFSGRFGLRLSVDARHDTIGLPVGPVPTGGEGSRQ